MASKSPAVLLATILVLAVASAQAQPPAKGATSSPCPAGQIRLLLPFYHVGQRILFSSLFPEPSSVFSVVFPFVRLLIT